MEDRHYRVPKDLLATETKLRRIAVVGSCAVQGWPVLIPQFAPGCECDYLLWNNGAEVPPDPPHPASDYDFLIAQIPLRSVLPESQYFRLRWDDEPAYASLLEQAQDRIRLFLAQVLTWNEKHGILSFVYNFTIPQQNAMGRLLPKADLRNMSFFVAQINQFIEHEVASNYKNAYIFDSDGISAMFGRRYTQDDMLWVTNHGAALTDIDAQFDQARIEPAGSVHDIYPTRLWQAVQASWDELVAMYRTARQIDAVKIVIFDLDDTLWRGVAADREEGSNGNIEGWPLGLAEALAFLKRRGVLLAIVSKNSEERVRQLWDNHYRPTILSLDDFAVIKINWEPKSENIAAVLSEVNLLPQNALFVDDNPREREEATAALPGLRTLGSNPYLWRRILLWAPEMQPARITTESASRTEMVQAQVKRNTAKSAARSREEWLSSLEVRVRVLEPEPHSAGYIRAFELLNKTNQFNTSGKRWGEAEFRAFLAAGARLYAFEAEDRFTQYGIIAVAIVNGASIEQFVMSCRVVGMEIENAALAFMINDLARVGAERVTGTVVETGLNLLSRDLYAKTGFDQTGPGQWAFDVENQVRGGLHARVERASRTPA